VIWKLGYLDDSWNVTSPKRGIASEMPPKTKSETASGAAAKLRATFLSDSCNGHWQPGGTCTPTVLNILRSSLHAKPLPLAERQNRLGASSWSSRTLFKAILTFRQWKRFGM